MKKNIFYLLIIFLPNQNLYSQAFDEETYLKLLNSNKIEFVEYAESRGLTIEIDSLAESIFAKKKGCLFTKPLGIKNNNDKYNLALIVSTLNKENNWIILKNAKENQEKKGEWTDDKYLYKEWDIVNPFSNEMWYRVVVYEKK